MLTDRQGELLHVLSLNNSGNNRKKCFVDLTSHAVFINMNAVSSKISFNFLE